MMKHGQALDYGARVGSLPQVAEACHVCLRYTTGMSEVNKPRERPGNGTRTGRIADRSLDGFNVYDADRRLRAASQTTQNIREASDFRGGVVVHQGNSDGSRFLA